MKEVSSENVGIMRLSNNQSELHPKSFLSNFWGAVHLSVA